MKTNTVNSKSTSKAKSVKNSQNATAESQLKASFVPQFNAQGQARLTFCGVEHSVSEWVDKKTGEHREEPKLKLVFSCLDVTHENPVNMGIRFNYRISPSNSLGLILNKMGFEFTTVEETVDSDDEFGKRQKPVDSKQIFDFLRGSCGLVFKAQLKPQRRKNEITGEWYDSKLWNIDHKTLEPMLDKAGTQKRDFLPGEVDDEVFENPEVDYSSDSN